MYVSISSRCTERRENITLPSLEYINLACLTIKTHQSIYLILFYRKTSHLSKVSTFSF